MGRLTGKNVLITGGNSGIGLATARRFVREGAFVFITGRRQAELDKAVAEIGHDVRALQGDVSSLDDLDRIIATIREKRVTSTSYSRTPASPRRHRSVASPRRRSTRSSTSTSRDFSSPCRRRCR